MGYILIFYAIVSALILFIEIAIECKQRNIMRESVTGIALTKKYHWLLYLLISIFWFPIIVGFGIYLLLFNKK